MFERPGEAKTYQDLRQFLWKMWLQGSFLAEGATISSLQMMHTLSALANSSGVASGYRVFMLWIARRESTTSLKAFLKALMVRYIGLTANRGRV